MARRRDRQALIYAHDLRELQAKVVAPVLSQLRPIPHDLVGGPKGFLVQIAQDNSHNSLCYEMRLSFALTIGAAFERNLRLWLSVGQADLRPFIERADRIRLVKHVTAVKGLAASELIQAVDLIELWELVSTARHGDGPATKRLKALNPGLWSHQDEKMQAFYENAGLRAYTIRVGDSDIERYFRATIGFWDVVGGRKNKPKGTAYGFKGARPVGVLG